MRNIDKNEIPGLTLGLLLPAWPLSALPPGIGDRDHGEGESEGEEDLHTGHGLESSTEGAQ